MKKINIILNYIINNSYLIGFIVSLSFTLWHYLAVVSRTENFEKLMALEVAKNKIQKNIVSCYQFINLLHYSINEDVRTIINKEISTLNKDLETFSEKVSWIKLIVDRPLSGEEILQQIKEIDRVIDNLNKKSEELKGIEIAKQLELNKSIDNSTWILNVFSYTLTVYLLIVFLLLRRRNALNKLLLEKMEQQNAVFRVLSDSIIVIDSNGKIVSANKNFYNFFPAFSNRIIDLENLASSFNKTDGTYFTKEDNPFYIIKNQQTVKNILATCSPRIFDLRWVSISTGTITANNNLVIHIKDITDIVLAQKTIEKHQEMLVQGAKFSALGQMAGGIAHEINNPINVINSETEDLKELATENQLKQNIVLKIANNIETTSKRMAKIVKGLRVFARTKEKEELRPEYIHGMLSDLEGIAITRLQKEGVKFEILPFDKSLMILCCEYQILQIFINLVNNAIDAVAPLNEKWIKIEIVSHTTSVSFLIMDSGKGIPSQNIDKLFTPFFTSKALLSNNNVGYNNIYPSSSNITHSNNYTNKLNEILNQKLPNKLENKNDNTLINRSIATFETVAIAATLEKKISVTNTDTNSSSSSNSSSTKEQSTINNSNITSSSSSAIDLNQTTDTSTATASSTPSPVPTCPANFIKIEETSPYDGFCVSYIESRKGGDDIVWVDKPNQKPWVSISATNAQTKCQALGSQYDLINNREWMVIARQIETEHENWSSDSIGYGVTYIGHSDNNPSREIAIQTNDTDGY
ncbi:MAG: hypothetical protein HQK51_20915, partial [Oligoflexia bacterium]|nr:hypothetical protein [Oligoflexia bacterium]